MKRRLALFLALVMIMSLIPANVFAASTNSIDSVPKVSDSYDVWATDASDAPLLRIEEKHLEEFGTTGTQTFKLELSNADWKDTSAAEMADNDSFSGNVASITYTKRSSSVMDVEVTMTDNSATAESFVRIPMAVEVTDAGDITVEINSVDSKVSDQKIIFATSSDGDTATTIDGDVNFGDALDLETLEIEELKIGTLEDLEGIVLQLPKNFKWHSDSESATAEYSIGFSDATAANTTFVIDDNTRRLKITTADLGDDNTERGTIYINGLKIVAESKAAFGEVEVKIYGDDLDASRNENVTTETFVVGKYVNYSVIVEADGDPADLFAGDFEDYDADEQELQVLKIEEDIASSWLTERRTRIELPSWVKILSVTVPADDQDNFDDTITTTDFEEFVGEEGNAESYVELSGEAKSVLTDKTELQLTFFVSIEADKTGDIVATVSGSSLEEDTDVVLGKAIAPVTVTTTVEDVRTGLQDQKIGNITITEAAEEVITEGKNLIVALDKSWFNFSDDPTVEVTKGDLEIDEDAVKIYNNVLLIPIKSESSVASTIEITNLMADLDRAVPEGDFVVEIGGSAIVKNATEWWTVDYDTAADIDTLVEGGFATSYVAKGVIARVITPADADTMAGQEVKFTIDSKDYMVGETVVTSDVAPFINAQNRTMLPLRAFANAVGVSDENIVWNGTERSVTIFKGEAVVKVIIGEMSFMKNGVSVPMDTAAVIKDGRTFLPVRAIAQALGAQVEWDAATRSVMVK